MTISNTALRYFSLRQRLRRTLLTIVALYLILNGSDWCLVLGTPKVLIWLWQTVDPFWAGIASAAIAVALLLVVLFAARRWRLALSQMDLVLNGAWTLGVVALMVIAVLAAGRLSGGWLGSDHYMTIFQWTWQIPVGVFIGRGLSWSIVDRKIAGVYSTDERALEEEA